MKKKLTYLLLPIGVLLLLIIVVYPTLRYKENIIEQFECLQKRTDEGGYVTRHFGVFPFLYFYPDYRQKYEDRLKAGRVSGLSDEVYSDEVIPAIEQLKFSYCLEGK